jgi:hypothetical protein
MRCGSCNSGMTRTPPVRSVPALKFNIAVAEDPILMITGFTRSCSLHVEPRSIFETSMFMCETRAIRLKCRIRHLVNA